MDRCDRVWHFRACQAFLLFRAKLGDGGRRPLGRPGRQGRADRAAGCAGGGFDQARTARPGFRFSPRSRYGRRGAGAAGCDFGGLAGAVQ